MSQVLVYHRNKIANQAGDSKKIWNSINNLLGKRKSNLASSFLVNGETVTDNCNILSVFNNYFSNIGSSLADNIPDVHDPFYTYLPEPLPFSFYLMPTTVFEVESIIDNMKVSSPGHDDIAMKIIKECSKIISPFLVFLINKSF